ncbi:MAG: hypothetical protein ACRC6O_13370 [Flavobacterium sp.]
MIINTKTGKWVNPKDLILTGVLTRTPKPQIIEDEFTFTANVGIVSIGYRDFAKLEQEFKNQGKQESLFILLKARRTSEFQHNENWR